jgi:hypothetical protein
MENVLRAIAVILALILAVMLFGADAVKGGMASAVVVAIGLAILGAVLAMLSGFVSSLGEEVAKSKSEGRAWRWQYILYPAMFAFFVVAVWAAISADWDQKGAWGRSFERIPYAWVPLALGGFAFLVAFIESAPKWLPKIPGATIDFLNGWASTFIAPVTYPRQRWAEINAERMARKPVGKLYAAGSVLWSFVGGCAQFIAGCTLMGLVVVMILKAAGALR